MEVIGALPRLALVPRDQERVQTPGAVAFPAETALVVSKRKIALEKVPAQQFGFAGQYIIFLVVPPI